ncbi:MAG: DUF503 domain-containing protein [Spirochaetota bacterium]
MDHEWYFENGEAPTGDRGPFMFDSGFDSMKVLVSKIELVIPHACSLKDKRSVIRGLKDRVWSKFRVSISEVDQQDVVQRAMLGLVYVSNDGCLLERIMNKIVRLVEESYPGLLYHYEYFVEHY